MTRGHTAIRRIASQSKQTTRICSTCLHQLRAASTAASPIESNCSDQAPHTTPVSQAHHSAYKIKASVLLSRPPLLTRELTPFEKSYYLYQRRLNERLALPFTRYFYYQKGTPGDVEWKRKIKERRTPARDIGAYSAYGDEGWNDELLVGDRVSEPEEQTERLVKDAEVEVIERDIQGEGEVVKKEEIERPMPRITEDDKNGNLRSLTRRLERTLYLVVTRDNTLWEFPTSLLEAGKESLHTASERIIVQTGGVNMNTWVVGNMPIGHKVYNYSNSVVNKEQGTEIRGEKTFFMKARMMAGQANLKDNVFGLQDFQWLDREETRKAVNPRDWAAVKNILSER